MENQNNQMNIDKSKSKFWKFAIGFFGVIFVVFVLYVVSIWVFRAYQQWQGEKAVQKTVEALKKFEADDYAKAMADTYGGKTPEETLQMYINAVEKGDYELASKYFIGDRQEEKLKSLKNSAIISPKGMIDNYLKTLKMVLNETGEYAMDRSYFSFNGEILVRMKVYPNGIWKIIEI